MLDIVQWLIDHYLSYVQLNSEKRKIEEFCKGCDTDPYQPCRNRIRPFGADRMYSMCKNPVFVIKYMYVINLVSQCIYHKIGNCLCYATILNLRQLICGCAMSTDSRFIAMA